MISSRDRMRRQNRDYSATMGLNQTSADLQHLLAHIAPRSRPLYVIVDFEVFGNIHGKWPLLSFIVDNILSMSLQKLI